MMLPNYGISRRDWLAALAMQSLISGEINIQAKPGQSRRVTLEAKAYEIADAMIKEGKKDG